MADNLPDNPFVAGSRQVSAGMLNALTRQAKAEAMSTFDGDTDTVAGIRHLTPSPGRSGFWAKLTGEGTGDEAGQYAWTEQELNGYVFSDLADGRSGTTTANYAKDPNGQQGIPADTIVWLIPGDPTETAGEVSENWLIAAGVASAGGQRVAVITDFADVVDDCVKGRLLKWNAATHSYTDNDYVIRIRLHGQQNAYQTSLRAQTVASGPIEVWPTGKTSSDPLEIWAAVTQPDGWPIMPSRFDSHPITGAQLLPDPVLPGSIFRYPSSHATGGTVTIGGVPYSVTDSVYVGLGFYNSPFSDSAWVRLLDHFDYNDLIARDTAVGAAAAAALLAYQTSLAAYLASTYTLPGSRITGTLDGGTW